ncbi:hypothetical protein Tco_0132205 [Tanacetum coccineum]
MFVRPVWRKKLNYCNSSNEVDVNLPTPMPKPPSHCNEPPKENSPIAPSNQVLPSPHSPPLLDPYVVVALQATHNTIPTPPPPPLSPTRERLIDEINQLQDLSNLLAVRIYVLVRNGYLRKGAKRKPKTSNRARNGKDKEKDKVLSHPSEENTT